MITIRLANQNDISALADLDKLCNPTPWLPTQFQAALNNTHDVIWLAQQQQEIVGLIVWQSILNEIELHLIATHPQHRRKGIASKLLNKMFQAAQQQNTKKILLEVRASNQVAQTLYQQQGFQIIGTRRQYYRNQEDAVIMEKTC